MDWVVNSITSAFHRANAVTDPAERPRVFIEELELFLRAAGEPVMVEGQAAQAD